MGSDEARPPYTEQAFTNLPTPEPHTPSPTMVSMAEGVAVYQNVFALQLGVCNWTLFSRFSYS